MAQDQDKERRLGVWGKYLTLWVALCIGAGIGLGKAFPGISDVLADLTFADVSIPVAVCLFLMIYPIMVQIPFGQVVEAAKTPKPIIATLVANWAIKPFTMAFFAWLFIGVVFKDSFSAETAEEYRAGMILLGVAPCTAMVLMWSYLAKGNMGHTLVMTAVNSLTMVVLFAPLAGLLLGISGIDIPWGTVAFSVAIYICVPLVFGYWTRKQAIKQKGVEWFETRLVPSLQTVSIVALLITLVVLFSLQGDVITEIPSAVGMIAVGIFCNILLVFGFTYLVAKRIRLSYEDAAPTAIIAGSNHFEVAVAVATTVFGLSSGAVLATVVGVLTEVPFMLFLVWLCKKTKRFFPTALA
ncbi:MAG: ACR3 family arsenite efflux transporter [Dehalococcoidia bacterium]|nr:ACR3 family arsenite efflux transporter [Dehalococcoidia bacterium]